MTDILSGLDDDLEAQKEFVAQRVPVYARLLELLAEDVLHSDEVREALRRVWQRRSFDAWYERPLLILAALRYDALSDGPAHPLYPAIAAHEPDPDAATPDALKVAFAAARERVWHALETRHLQTNDSTRAMAWLWPASMLGQLHPERPLELFDVGASAGLNLVADRLPAVWKRADGLDLPVGPLPPIVGRTGLDLRPLDVLSQTDVLWLRACTWPGQQDRLDRLDRSVEAFRALFREGDPPKLVSASAADIPAKLPVYGAGERSALAYQSIFRDYLGQTERESYERGMRRWLAQSAPGHALWIEFEVTSEARQGGPPVALTAHLVGADQTRKSFVLASSEPHPRIVDVDQSAAEAFRRALV